MARALDDVPLPEIRTPVPPDVRAFLREAERRIEEFQRASRIPGFVASDFERAYLVLRALSEANLTPGNLFCEWGSGFGVVTCLAAMLDFDAVGIEIESDLVDEAQRLADDFSVPAEFFRGSFIPRGVEVDANTDDNFAWLTTDESGAQELELEPDDFDVIFAYPWPDEEDVTQVLFENHAAPHALLVTYHGGDEFRVRRKKKKKRLR